MKKYLILLLLLDSFQSSFAQKDSVFIAPYLRFPKFPPVNLVLSDSSVFNKESFDKKSNVFLMLFSPDCDHCQHETEEILKNIDKFKKTQIIMATWMPFEKMLEFRIKFGLARFSNIIVGHDKGFFLPAFFNVRNLPFLAFYNKKKELISVFEGNMSIPKILEILAD